MELLIVRQSLCKPDGLDEFYHDVPVPFLHQPYAVGALHGFAHAVTGDSNFISFCIDITITFLLIRPENKDLRNCGMH